MTNNYDAASRLSVIGDTTNSATYSYLANSAWVSQIVFKQSSTTRMTTTKGYDNLNRFLGVTNVNASSVVLDKHAYGYNSANQRTAVTNTDSSYWNFNYDFLGQVTAGKKYWSDGVAAAGEQFGYGFDDIGNRVNAQAGGNERGVGLRNSTYYVNDLNQYTSRTVPGFADIVGSSSTSSTVTVNGLSTYRHSDFFRAEVPINNTGGAVWQTITNLGVLGGGSNTVSNITGNIFLPKNPELFTYDNDGNMTSDGRFTNVWDGENRLITITSKAGAATASLVKLDITYDYMERRIQKIVSTNSGSGYVASYTNRFVYDGWNVVAILDGGNHLMYSFVWGLDLSGTIQGAGGVGGLLSMTVYTGPNLGSYFYCYDGNGNVTALINATDGTIVALYEYNPFGELIGATGRMAFANSIRFSTKYQDDETGWHYYGYRYLRDSGWLSRDPIEEKGGLDLYAFVRNNGVGLSDPDGLDIYVTTGNDSGDLSNDSLHQSIFVDTWSVQDIRSNNTNAIPTGKVGFSFGKIEGLAGFRVVGPKTTWLGWKSYTFCCLKGQIYRVNVDFTATTINRQLHTTPQQDWKWLNYMSMQRLGQKDGYSLARHNCRKYSNMEFNDAQKHFQ